MDDNDDDDYDDRNDVILLLLLLLAAKHRLSIYEHGYACNRSDPANILILYFYICVRAQITHAHSVDNMRASVPIITRQTYGARHDNLLL